MQMHFGLCVCSEFYFPPTLQLTSLSCVIVMLLCCDVLPWRILASVDRKRVYKNKKRRRKEEKEEDLSREKRQGDGQEVRNGLCWI